jgi:hypothetical protein
MDDHPELGLPVLEPVGKIMNSPGQAVEPQGDHTMMWVYDDGPYLGGRVLGPGRNFPGQPQKTSVPMIHATT